MFMKMNNGKHSIAKMAKVLGVSRSGYYAWDARKPSRHEHETLILEGLIRQIFIKHLRRYGSPRIWAELRALGWRVGKKRVERLMRKQRLRANRRRKRVKTADCRHHFLASENVLNREFAASFPGEKWVSDITHLRTSSGSLYLTIVLDLWDRKVVGWSMSKQMTAEQASLALNMAANNRRPREGLIFHSDQGAQYCSEEFRNALKRLCPSVRQSMSRKGNCWDNACAESFIKTLKAELEILNGRNNLSQVKTAVFEYIEVYYNRCRRHSALGYATPLAFAANIAA
jgi:transposase InsO family protein